MWIELVGNSNSNIASFFSRAKLQLVYIEAN